MRGKLLQTQRAVGGIIFYTAIAFVGCRIVGSLVNTIAQIVFSEVMAEIVIAITAISVAAQVEPATVVITEIITVFSSIVVPTIVSALTVVWWDVVARATLVGWLWAT